MTRLDSVQITSQWQNIAQAIIRSLPPGVDASPFTVPRVFQALIDGTFQAWFLWRVENGERRVCMIATTRWMKDAVTGGSDLWIFSLFGLVSVPEEALRNAFKTIESYAKGGGAKYVLAYSQVPRVLDIAKMLNANTDNRLIVWEV